MLCFNYKHARSTPFWLYLILPLGGISFLAREWLSLGAQEWFLVATVVWFGVFNKTRKLSVPFLFLNTLFFLYFLVSYILCAQESESLYGFLKSIKPYFFISIVFAFLTIKNKSYLVNFNSIPALVFTAVTLDVAVWLGLVCFPELMPGGIRKEFFIRNNIYRYSDLAVLLLQSLTILGLWCFNAQPKKLIITIATFIMLVCLTQDRVFLVFGLATVLVSSAVRLKLIRTTIAVGTCLGLFMLLSIKTAHEPMGRLANLANFDLLLNEFIVRFINPVIQGGYKFTPSNFLFGEGINFKFYIPWYEYRGLDVFHNSVDSFFVTFFIKHGILGLLILFSIIHLVIRNFPTILYVWVVLYLCMHNGLHLPSFLMMLVFLSFLYDYKKPIKH